MSGGSLSRQFGFAHEIFIDGARRLTAFADRPDDQRLALADIAGSENLVERSPVVIGIGFDIAALVALERGFLQQAAFFWTREADGDQNEIGPDDEFGPGQRLTLLIDPGAFDAGHFSLLTDDAQRRRGKFARGTLGLR